ncbi:MAG: radical SAM protein [Deltaproteobacteria bacterium]|nr:radical SAM protein [Deltaproteobacteria bacterium]
MDAYRGFEQGPIRPPSEADSLLLRLTRNCPWNRCTFCPVYKERKFSLRPVDDILRDIDTIYELTSELQQGRRPLSTSEQNPEKEYALQVARNWVSSGMTSVFLQDADSLVLKPEQTIRILCHIRELFPTVKRITSYGRSHTIARISTANLREMAEAGLNRIHIGMETAADRILEMVRKGADKDIHIKAGIKTREAGIELSEYVLIGIGGEQFWREHAIETADAMNQINPDFIRFRTLHILDSLNLFENSEQFTWQRPTDLTIAEEVLLFIDGLDGISSCVKSDHMYNLFQELDGTLPQDKERLQGVLQKFINMEPKKRICFQLGKRLGHFLRLSDMDIPNRLARVEDICVQLGMTPENADRKINDIIQERMRDGWW